MCLGIGYTPKAHFVWVKILSRILKVMIPVAVAFEIHSGGENQKSRLAESNLNSKAPSSAASVNSEDESDILEKKYGYK